MIEDEVQTIWNMDEAVLRTVHQLKVLFIYQLHNWQLDEAYWTIRSLWMEVDAKFKPKERKEAITKIEDLEGERQQYVQDKIQRRSDFYLKLEKFYIFLNRLMKEHGIFFREKLDVGL